MTPQDIASLIPDGADQSTASTGGPEVDSLKMKIGDVAMWSKRIAAHYPQFKQLLGTIQATCDQMQRQIAEAQLGR